ncbi:MAG: phage tail sheath C-terminal domain-containing protein [bacterium]
MPIQPTYPGVYVQEVPSGVKTIMGVSTSVAMFIGRSMKGKLKEPVLCNSYTDFVREFSNDASLGEMPQQVKMFFDNGGSKCFAMRIADGATYSRVTLKNEAGPVSVMEFISKQPGDVGNLIRISIDYGTQYPEIDFNVRVFRYEVKNGNKVVAEAESFANLSMDDKSPRYAPTYITQKSKLVDAEICPTMPQPVPGFSQSCLPIEYTPATAGPVAVTDQDAGSSISAAWNAICTSTSNVFLISVDNFRPIEINLSDLDFTDIALFPTTTADDFLDAVKDQLKGKINDKLDSEGHSEITVSVNFIDGPVPYYDPAGPTLASKMIRITSDHNGNVLVFPSPENDLAVPLMLGTAQGGIEVGAYSLCRPAPNGISLVSSSIPNIVSLGGVVQSALTSITTFPDMIIPAIFDPTTETTKKVYNNQGTVIKKDGIREKLIILRDFINDYANNHPAKFYWQAALYGYRLTITSTQANDNAQALVCTTGTTDIFSYFTKNVKVYSLGNSGKGSYQFGTSGNSGNTPKLQNYIDAFDVIDKEVDIFNLMVLPCDKDENKIPISLVWGQASVFCQKRRAFLLMDAPEWETVQDALDGIVPLRIGLIKDHSAMFYPSVRISDGGIEKSIGPCGAIAGLMERIDNNRGVWKPPAGKEAFLTGVNSLTKMMTDRENGNLNPKALNIIRVFPNGIVNWGARTMDGDDDFQSEYKYIPVRRLALYMEESLYRGLKWVVFEPNDEPLWAQIRLNVGAFMHDLFIQGAFQGGNPKDAYFVKCDKETTTQNDINRGVVNIWVGFAPLKPAEFVILSIQQMAGQINQ